MFDQLLNYRLTNIADLTNIYVTQLSHNIAKMVFYYQKNIRQRKLDEQAVHNMLIILI